MSEQKGKKRKMTPAFLNPSTAADKKDVKKAPAKKKRSFYANAGEVIHIKKLIVQKNEEIDICNGGGVLKIDEVELKGGVLRTDFKGSGELRIEKQTGGGTVTTKF